MAASATTSSNASLTSLPPGGPLQPHLRRCSLSPPSPRTDVVLDRSGELADLTRHCRRRHRRSQRAQICYRSPVPSVPLSFVGDGLAERSRVPAWHCFDFYLPSIPERAFMASITTVSPSSSQMWRAEMSSCNRMDPPPPDFVPHPWRPQLFPSIVVSIC